MSSAAETNKSRKKRTITRRIRDAEGNIIVKQYQRRESFFDKIDINWLRVPSVLLGIAFGLLAYVANLHRTGQIGTDNYFGYYLEAFYANFTNIPGGFVIGALVVGLSVAIGWALIMKGFNPKKWPGSWRILFTVIAVTILLTAVFSAFINEQGFIRHEDEPKDAQGDYDVSQLTSPFYSELIEGLMDLLGNIPDPQETVAKITPTSGTFDPNEDTYMYRWLVPETYNQETYDWDKNYDDFRTDFTNMNPSNIPANVSTRELEVAQQYLTLGTSSSREIVAPHNSVYDVQADFSDVTADLVNTTGELLSEKTTGSLNINQQPLLEAYFSEARTQGFLNYDSLWVEEDKDAIIQNAIPYNTFEGQMASESVNLPEDRFGDFSKKGSVSEIWGLDSLGGPFYRSGQLEGGEAFAAEYNRLFNTFNGTNPSVYDVVLTIANRIQSEIINYFITGNNVDAMNPSSDAYDANSAPDGVDKAFYFFEQIADDGPFGIKDAIAGLVNMIRSFDIPARPIIGFSLGDITSNEITVKMGHIHVWMEAMIPWTDANNDTQYSWGMFNVLPDFNRALEGEFEYGKNNLGSTPQVEMYLEGDTESLPQDSPPIAEQDNFIVGQKATPVNGGARVLFEGNPAAGQELSLKILTESDTNGFDPNSVDVGGLNVGTELGTVVTDQNGWANFSLLADSAGQLFFSTPGENQTLVENTTINNLNVAGTEGNRNIYGIFATFSTSYNFSLIGWTVNGTLKVSTNLPQYTIPSLQSPEGFETDTSFVFPGETIEVYVNFTSTTGDPIPGETGIILQFEIASDVSQVQQNIQDGTFTPSGENNFGATNQSGIAAMNFTVPASSTPDEYYALMAILPTGFLYGQYFVHVTDDLNVTLTGQSRASEENVIYLDETDTWDVSFEAYYHDSLFEDFSPDPVQPKPTDVMFDFYLVEEAAYDANSSSASQMSAMLDECQTDGYGEDFRLCYLLTEAPDGTSMGYSGSTRTGSDGQLTVTIQLEGGDIQPGTYYIVSWNSTYGIYNNTDLFAFHPDTSPFFAMSSEDTINNDQSPTLSQDFEIEEETTNSSDEFSDIYEMNDIEIITNKEVIL